MYESSESQFFRTTIRTQSRPDKSDESRVFITFLTTFGGTEILCSFRIVLVGKTGKEVPESSRLEFSEKLLANHFALSDVEDNTSRPLNRGGTANLPLLRILLAIRQKSREPSSWELIDSFVLVAYASLAASRNLLQWLLACLSFTLDRRFILLLQTKKVVSINYGSITNSWKPLKWVWLDVIFTLRDIYINSNLNTLTKVTSSRRSTEFKEVFLWSISQMTTKTVPISTRIVISYVMKRNIPFWVWKKQIGNWDNSLIRIS